MKTAEMIKELESVAEKLDGFGDSISGDTVVDAAEMINNLQAQLVGAQRRGQAAKEMKAQIKNMQRKITEIHDAWQKKWGWMEDRMIQRSRSSMVCAPLMIGQEREEYLQALELRDQSVREALQDIPTLDDLLALLPNS